MLARSSRTILEEKATKSFFQARKAWKSREPRKKEAAGRGSNIVPGENTKASVSYHRDIAHGDKNLAALRGASKREIRLPYMFHI